MKQILLILSIFILLVVSNMSELVAQRVGFFSSQMVRDKLPDAKLAEQRCQTMVDEWKRELKSMEDKEEQMVFDAKKNRLIWSDAEKTQKDKELSDLQAQRVKYAKEKFEPNGEYDKIVREVMKPVEEKIFAAVQDVASKEKYDFIWDQSTQPLSYVNFKYDITLKVLKVLGVDVSADEKIQEQKIANDARNDEDKKKESSSPRRRSRTTPTKEESSSSPTSQPLQEKERSLGEQQDIKPKQ